MRPKVVMIRVLAALVAALAVALVAVAGQAQELFSLKGVAVPPVSPVKIGQQPAVITDFISDNNAAIVLGKAFFWEQQLGSDGMACASCHFHAGADSRLKNQLSPGLLTVAPDPIPHTFDPTASGGKGGPNYTLKPADFPFHKFVVPNCDPNPNNLPDIPTCDPRDPASVKFDTNDVASSAGTFDGSLIHVRPGVGDQCNLQSEEFNVNGIATRKVEPRNTPAAINAALNFRHFWDGRANNVFNGVNPFGLRDPKLGVDPDHSVFDNQSGTLQQVKVELHNSSAASQAVGPPLSKLEMSCNGRLFKDIAQKLLNRRALQDQEVSATDSVLGPYRHASGLGLTQNYVKLIQAAFQPRWWNAPGNVNNSIYSQMELNFSLFWGLAIQAYEQTLISDEAPIDKYFGVLGDALHPPDPTALTDQQKLGLTIFQDPNGGKCVNCHSNAEFTGAATRLQPENQENGLVERMVMGDDGVALYDNAFYNIGVRPTKDDLGVGGTDPFGNPLSFTRQYLDLLRGKNVPDPFQIDECTFNVLVDPTNCAAKPDPNTARVAVDGAFKTPSLRNVALTQPYFHNGGQFTLEQVVAFYNRGGDRLGQNGNDTTGFAPNGSNLDADIRPLGLDSDQQKALVAFLRFALTDKRVACEQAPFDHPSLTVPNGHKGDELSVQEGVGNDKGKAVDDPLLIPAVGAGGLPAIGKPCLTNDDGSPVP